jgi:GR25 family glycosyltransferase involved in LPS biosynthesis
LESLTPYNTQTNHSTHAAHALDAIKGYMITAAHETSREPLVQKIVEQLPGIERIEAVYPSRVRIPFLHRLQAKSKQRTGYALNEGEIGVLLSNRKIWRSILEQSRTRNPSGIALAGSNESYLVLESDSTINNIEVLKKYYGTLTQQYDLFFFGSWLGNTKIFKSTRQSLEQGFVYGTPFIKTISGGYGYALNAKAARHLLETSNRIAHPVDEFKRYITPGYLRIGAVLPELISEHKAESLIGERPHSPAKEKLKMMALNIRNTIITQLK